MQINLYSPDAPGFLEFSKVKFRSKKSFCLPKDSSYDVRLFNDTINFEFCVYYIFYCKGLGCTRKCTPPCAVSWVSLITCCEMISRFMRFLTIISSLVMNWRSYSLSFLAFKLTFESISDKSSGTEASKIEKNSLGVVI
jgi:hypothetical protein